MGITIVLVNEKNLETLERDYTLLLKRNQNLSLIKNIFENILNNKNFKSKGKMFNLVTSTWNPVSGCTYNCKYCWARSLATTKLKNSHRYSNGFKPSLNEVEFRKKFKKGDFVFVSDMGDLFGRSVPANWIQKVLKHIQLFPEALFLFLTKNPSRYDEFISEMPSNAILGATIETNNDQRIRELNISSAPPVSERYLAMKNIEWEKKFVSIEPILDFDLQIFSKWIEEIYPFLVYVGYDNYKHNLPEPIMNKTMKLINSINKDSLVIKKTIRPAWFETKN